MYLFVLFSYLLVRLIIWIIRSINWSAFKMNLFRFRINNVNILFENNFIDCKVLFATRFNALANIGLITTIDTTKAYAFVMENFGNEIRAVYQYTTFDYDKNKALFNVTIFVLKNGRIIKLGYDYAEILYTGKNYAWANALLSDFANFRVTIRTKVIGFVNSEVLN